MQTTQPETTQTAQQQDKTTSTKVIPGNQNAQQSRKQKPTGTTPWRHMTRRQRKNRRRLKRLMELWPELFSLEEPKPLKEGVFDDLLNDVRTRELPIGDGVLRAAIMSYTRRVSYLKTIVAGGARYDLNGQPCGEVSAEEQEHARMLLMDMSTKKGAP
ncbi:TPA: ProQ/FinO family protein [Escherichia coli]|nr:ProQ/FinO family protein [Escherichia coli]HEL8022072.1 ProQ/FinO family protein [Escherichia coli]HEL8042170.1 ProQ/FinO family protein [Escherichia coli]HEL8045278.1 ProQ/FinO family protein [Escherichia coli]HEL8051902.1 ProQ/FinO family protein [Escherichia coli]